MLLIPAIDLRDGRCVRLFQGDFDAETRYDPEPHELLLRYLGFGASWLHVVDLDGAKDGVLANRAVIVALASQKAVKLQVGGGVRSAAVIDDLLRNGVERVSWEVPPWSGPRKSLTGSRILAPTASASPWIFVSTRAASPGYGHMVGKTGRR